MNYERGITIVNLLNIVASTDKLYKPDNLPILKFFLIPADENRHDSFVLEYKLNGWDIEKSIQLWKNNDLEIGVHLGTKDVLGGTDFKPYTLKSYCK